MLITNIRSGRGLSWTHSLQTSQKCTKNGEEQHDHSHSTLSIKHLVTWKESAYISMFSLRPLRTLLKYVVALVKEKKYFSLDRHMLIDLSLSVQMETKLSSYLSAKSRCISLRSETIRQCWRFNSQSVNQVNLHQESHDICRTGGSLKLLDCVNIVMF